MKSRLAPLFALAVASLPPLDLAQAQAPTAPAAAAAPSNAEVEAEWQTLSAQSPNLDPPAAWRQTEPTEAEVKAWMQPEGQRLLKVAAGAQAFAEKFPASHRAEAAWKMATEALFAATRLQVPGADGRLAELDKKRLALRGISDDERLQIRLRQVEQEATAILAPAQAQVDASASKGVDQQAAAAARLEQAEAAARQLYVTRARELQKEFPGRAEPYAMLLEVASEGETAANRALLTELAESESTPGEVKARAKEIQQKVALLGKPLDLKFTALDGRVVDLSQMRGKVVLIDFWATWCGPCIAALPGVKNAYAELSKLNFEIIGVSFDRDKKKVEEFVKAKEMPWPQYFDGKEWANELGRRFGITSIPAMWLVDQNGILRDLHAETNLEGKARALLMDRGATP